MTRVRASLPLAAFVLLFSLCAPPARAQFGKDIRTSRPRLFVASGDMGRAPRNLEQLGAHVKWAGSERLAELKGAALTGPERIPAAGLRLLLDSADTALVADALAEIDALSALPSLDAEQALLLALGFDWLFDLPAFGETRKQKAAAALKAFAEPAAELFTAGANGDIFDNRSWLTVRSAIAAAIALAGHDAGAAALFDKLLTAFNVNLAPALCYSGGAWHEAVDGSLLGVGRASSDLLLLVRGATGIDPRRTCSTVFGELATFGAWQMLPDGGWLAHGDLAPSRAEQGDGYRSVFDALGVLGPAGQPSVGAAVSGIMEQRGIGYRPEELWRAVLFEKAAEPAALPAGGAMRFGHGSVEQMVFRTGFDPGATVLSFRAGDWFTESDHLDQGGFSLFRKGWLAVDSGVPESVGSAHREAYAMRSVAHNVVTVRHEGAVFPSRHPGIPAVNDGGQRIVGVRKGVPAPPSRYLGIYTEHRSGELGYDTGDVFGFFGDAEFAAAEAQLVRAYDAPTAGGELAPRLTGYVRRIAWLGGRLIVVQDRLGLVRATDPVRWLLHTAVEPVRAGRRWVVSNGGVLGLRTLLPPDAESTVIGGPGREYFVDGQNVAPATAERPASAGTHRIEVSAPAGDQVTFLNVLRVGDTEAEAAEVDAAQLVPATGALALRLGDDVLLLPEGAGAFEQAVYEVDGDRPLRHHVVGARPDTEYLVAAGGLEVERPRSGRDGSLKFTTESGGRFLLKQKAPPKTNDGGFVDDPCAFGKCEQIDDVDIPCGCSSGMAAGIGGWVWLLGPALLTARLRRRRR